MPRAIGGTSNKTGVKNMDRPIKGDPRYTITREFCGYETARFVARFCDEWIGQGQHRVDAVMLCLAHSDKRARALKGV
jgi:hypothetical protein